MQVYALAGVKEGEWLVQPKLDGHNSIIFKEQGKIAVLSRQMNKLGVSPVMLSGLAHLAIEEGTVLNGEWTSRRQAYKVEEMYLFDLLYVRGEWVGNLSMEERYARLEAIYKASAQQAECDAWPVYLVPCKDTGYAAYYKSLVGDMKTEGIVLKKKDAPLIGNLSRSVENPYMLKVKWRSGADGQTVCVMSDAQLQTKP
jgi:ATP-dependent DNA ligase